MSAPSRTYLPAVLRFEIGGFFANCQLLELQAGRLEYRHAERAYVYGEPVTIVPAAAQWEQFWKRVAEAGVWSWREQYWDNDICDGCQWSLDMVYEGHSIHCYGSNAYLGSAGPDYSADCSFGLLLQALRELTGLRSAF